MCTTQVLPLSSKPLSLKRARSVLYCQEWRTIDQTAQEDEAIPQDELDDKTENDSGTHEYVVSTGDTLSSVLNQYGIEMGDIQPAGQPRIKHYATLKLVSNSPGH